MAEKRKVRVACDEEEIGKVEPGFCGLLIAPEKSSATAPTTSGFASLERYPENEYLHYVFDLWVHRWRLSLDVVYGQHGLLRLERLPLPATLCASR